MELWDRLVTIFRMMRGYGLRHFELTERLQTALVDRADRKQMPAHEIQAEAVAVELYHLNTADKLKECWDTLSRRERDVTAYTCLGYTNRMMASTMVISPEKVKVYLRNALFKLNLHGKTELRLTLAEWNFQAWGPKAQD